MKGRTILGLMLALLLLNAIADAYRWGFDDTDNVETGERSDMSVFTDHGTGCQYLARWLSGLTPRLDQNGNPMCKNTDARSIPR